MAKRQFANSPTNPTTTLAVGIVPADTEVTLTSDPGDEMPTAGPFTIIVGEDGAEKPLDCASRAGLTVTLVGTAGVTVASGQPVNTAPAKIDADAWLQADDLLTAPVSAAQAAADATKQPLDADLTTIAAIAPGAGHVLAADGAGWISKSYASLKTALALVKGDVGLGNVDNTSDMNKPVSTAQAAADATKQPLDADLTAIAAINSGISGVVGTLGSGWVGRSWTQVKTSLALVKGDVGLGNVDNTSDVNKPVSTAQAAADAVVAANADLLAQPDFAINFANRPDGACAQDTTLSGYRLRMTGPGLPAVVTGKWRNSVANVAGYLWLGLKRLPLAMTCNWDTISNGTNSTDWTAALVVSKKDQLLLDLVHVVVTRTGWAVQRVNAGSLTNIATGTFVTPLTHTANYSMTISKTSAASTTLTLTLPGIDTVTGTNVVTATHADIAANWGRNVFLEAQEQANSSKIAFNTWSVVEDAATCPHVTMTAHNRMARQPVAPLDGMPYLAESIPAGRYDNVDDSGGAYLTSGVIQQGGVIPVTKGVPIWRLMFCSGATAAGVPTNQWAALFDMGGTQLAVTADKTTEAWAADTKKEFFFAAAYVPTFTGFVVPGIMVKATTVPSLMVKQHNGVRFGLILTDPVGGRDSGTGRTTPTAVGSQLPITTASVNVPWAAVG